MYKSIFPLLFVLSCACICLCKSGRNVGPDPWDLKNDVVKDIHNDGTIPPDLRIPVEKPTKTDNSLGSGEWFFKRILNIVLRGGQVKKNEDDSVDISLKMRLDGRQWEILEEVLMSETSLTDDMYRRSVGYIEESIKPSITEKLFIAWSDYIQIYLTEYQFYITWSTAILGASIFIIWLWAKMSHRHFVIILGLMLYLYEVFITYKEAEKQELDRFVSAVEQCKWAFWSSSCDVPKPDPLIFLKHMNPLKIGVRMFTNLVSEPVITLSDTMKTIVHGMTDGLWYPFDKIVYAFLLLTMNILLLFLLVMVVFNFILNIPFNLSLFGLVNLGVMQRKRNLFTDTSHTTRVENSDRISGATLDKLIDVFSRALPPPQSRQTTSPRLQLTNSTQQSQQHGIRRSASTGRLSDLSSSFGNTKSIENIPRKRKITRHLDGSGDAN